MKQTYVEIIRMNLTKRTNLSNAIKKVVNTTTPPETGERGRAMNLAKRAKVYHTLTSKNVFNMIKISGHNRTRTIMSLKYASNVKMIVINHGAEPKQLARLSEFSNIVKEAGEKGASTFLKFVSNMKDVIINLTARATNLTKPTKDSQALTKNSVSNRIQLSEQQRLRTITPPKDVLNVRNVVIKDEGKAINLARPAAIYHPLTSKTLSGFPTRQEELIAPDLSNIIKTLAQKGESPIISPKSYMKNVVIKHRGKVVNLAKLALIFHTLIPKILKLVPATQDGSVPSDELEENIDFSEDIAANFDVSILSSENATKILKIVGLYFAQQTMNVSPELALLNIVQKP